MSLLIAVFGCTKVHDMTVFLDVSFVSHAICASHMQLLHVGCYQVTMETTISNYNKSLWQYVQPLNSVFESIRSMVANRLATSGGEWTELFSRFNSGT